jgi:hypothetical protein
VVGNDAIGFFQDILYLNYHRDEFWILEYEKGILSFRKTQNTKINCHNIIIIVNLIGEKNAPPKKLVNELLITDWEKKRNMKGFDANYLNKFLLLEIIEK